MHNFGAAFEFWSGRLSSAAASVGLFRAKVCITLCMGLHRKVLTRTTLVRIVLGMHFIGAQ